jgi:hypothetical protein
MRRRGLEMAGLADAIGLATNTVTFAMGKRTAPVHRSLPGWGTSCPAVGENQRVTHNAN